MCQKAKKSRVLEVTKEVPLFLKVTGHDGTATGRLGLLSKFPDDTRYVATLEQEAQLVLG